MLKKKKKKVAKRFYLVDENAPFQYREAYKSLRTNLKFLAADKACKKIILTSAIPGEGKSSVAINLAVSLAEAGSRVILIDCDLRKPTIHRRLHLQKETNLGLTNILTGGALKESIVNVPELDLDVVIADAIPPNPAELLSAHRMEVFIGELGRYYDYVIMDAPPVSVVTDAAILSQYADGVILVVRQNCATFDQVQLAKRNLETVHANVLGAVLNGFDMKSADKESGYYYSYNYDYNDK